MYSFFSIFLYLGSEAITLRCLIGQIDSELDGAQLEDELGIQEEIKVKSEVIRILEVLLC